MDTRGVPADQLADAELERLGAQAHATRNWVFLHGTAEQFANHTERMLELEQEYLRRHPKRTWQGRGGAVAEVDRDMRLRQLLRSFTAQVDALLGEEPAPAPGGGDSRALLERFAAAPGGRLHKLEAHQVARELGVSPAAAAELYRHDPPLLATAGSERVLTDAGREWLTSR
ncbi:MAG: DUF6158 family protein [Pseudonocardia sp.]